MRLFKFICRLRGYHQTWFFPQSYCASHDQLGGRAGCCHVCGTQYDGHPYVTELRFDLNKPVPKEAVEATPYLASSNSLLN
jgi:hypothetical protein